MSELPRPGQAGAHTLDSNVIPFPAREDRVQAGARVKRINQFGFYDLGRVLASIRQHALAGAPARPAFMPLIDAQAALQSVLSGFPMPLGVSRASAENLSGAIESLINVHFRTVDDKGEPDFRYPEENEAFQPWLVSGFQRALATFEAVFAEEMREAATYVVPPRGLYDIPSLVDRADRSIPGDVSSFVPEGAKIDWKAAGRCLAFDLPSASGFHVARAIESTVEAYYRAYLGQAPGEGRSWGDLIVDLEKVAQNPVPQPKTLALLRQIKDDWRNPVIHPRVTLTSTDAEVLFALGASVLIAVAQELKSVGESGIQPSLTLVSQHGAVA